MEDTLKEVKSLNKGHLKVYILEITSNSLHKTKGWVLWGLKYVHYFRQSIL